MATFEIPLASFRHSMCHFCFIGSLSLNIKKKKTQLGLTEVPLSLHVITTFLKGIAQSRKVNTPDVKGTLLRNRNKHN